MNTKKAHTLINRNSHVKSAHLHSKEKFDLYADNSDSELELADGIEYYPPAKQSEDPVAQYIGKLKNRNN